MNLEEYIISIDLGTTLIKCIIYNSKLKRIADCSIKYNLVINDRIVEFDANDYWHYLKQNLKKLIEHSGIDSRKVTAIGLSGQAESLILLDKNNVPLRKAISWMDMRSYKEVDEIKKVFNEEESYQITGQPEVITTLPVTKLLWLKKNEPNIYQKINKLLLLKDFIAYKFTGLFTTEYTTCNYSYYFDIFNKKYWEDILSFLNLKIKQLPELCEPGINTGKITSENLKYFNFKKDVFLNIGSNDQFAGMVGVGNITSGIISESTGTVLCIATIANSENIEDIKKTKIPVYYNAIKDTYAYLLVCESGGVCLEWLKNNFFKNHSFKEMDEHVEKIEKGSKGLIFLPYIMGTNSPENDLDMSGGFFNIRVGHNEDYFIRSVMESIGFLIKKNLIFLEKHNIKAKKIISLSGGSKSSVWNQIKADIINRNIIVTNENDPVGIGTAILISLELGYFRSLEEAVAKIIKTKEEFVYSSDEIYEVNYKKFIKYYDYLKESRQL